MKTLLLACCTIALLGSAVTVPAEDIKTIYGDEYKNATIKRTEPDGLVVMHATGIAKIPFSELPADLQRKHGFDPAAANAFATASADQQRALREANEARAAAQARQEQAVAELQRAAIERRNKEFIEAENARRERELRAKVAQYAVYAVVEPFRFEKDITVAWLQFYVQADTGYLQNRTATSLDRVPVKDWKKAGEKFIGVIAETMPRDMEAGDRTILPLYKIGHTADSQRHPRFTSNVETVVQWLKAGAPE
jgi:hypothetical protein